MKKILEDEDKNDQAMRTKFGEKWMRIESSKINAPFNFQIDEFCKKSQIAD